MLKKRSRYEMITRSLRYLVEGGIITNINPGSVVRSLLEVQNEELSSYYDSLQLNTAMGMLPFATGPFLDYIGDGLLATPRWAALKASVSKEDMNIKFYVTTGTLLALIPSAVIPSGTEIATTDGSITYVLTDDIIIDNVQTEVFVSAMASETGQGSNVGAGLLNTTSLGIEGLHVTNLYSVGSGVDLESDSNYRYRISNATLNFARANMMSIRLAALSVAGVSDAAVRDCRSGVGTFDILITPTGNTVATAIVRSVRAAVQSVKAVGILGSVTQPRYVPIEIVIRMYFTEGTPDGDKPKYRQDATTSLLKYIGEIRMGQTFVVNEMRQRVMEVSEKIFDMEVLCFRFRRRAQLVKNYVLETDELFIPDQQVSEPLKAV